MAGNMWAKLGHRNEEKIGESGGSKASKTDEYEILRGFQCFWRT